MRQAVPITLTLLVLSTIPSTALGQCKWECEQGYIEETNEVYARCVEYVSGMHDYNTCDVVKKCIPVAAGGEACTVECDTEWCYFV